MTLADPDTEKARIRMGPTFWMSTAWIATIVFVAILADVLPFRDPEALGIRTGEVGQFEGPGWNALFGGDSRGRDQLARVVQGTRPALIIGLAVTIIGGSLGTLLGLTAGYLRGRFDSVTSTIIDIALAFPGLVLLIAVRSSFGNSMTVFIILFSIVSIPAYARIIRGASYALSERDFVDAAESMGATKWRVLWRELAPNIAVPALAFAFIGFAVIIVAEGGLAFVDLSLDQVTWGQLIAEGTSDIDKHPHVSLIPASVMFATILAFNLVGDRIRAIVAPREVSTQRKLHIAGTHDRVAEGAALEIRDLHTTLHTPDGDVRAVDGVSLSVAAGESLAVVGESGSGKTMLLRSIVGAFALADVTRSGTVSVAGVDMLRADPDEIRSALGNKIGMISQNPLTALNPVRRIGVQITEPMTTHQKTSRSEAQERATLLLRQVGIADPEQALRKYPHELSGGMRQRVTIAIALANEPQLLLADEPTTALDVTIQDQILRLLADLQESQNMAMVLVTHDLAVVRGFADRVAIVYAGEVVELGPTDKVFAEPHHRYTTALMHAMPDLSLPAHSKLASIEGAPPQLTDPPNGCRFAARCPAAIERCAVEAPGLTGTDDHWYRCHVPANESSVVLSGLVAEAH